MLIAAFAPVLYLGRLLVDGFGPMTAPVRDVPGVAPRFGADRAGAWAGDQRVWRVVPALLRLNRLPLAAATAILVSVVGLSVAIGGLGPTSLADGALDPAPGALLPTSPSTP